MVLGTGCEEGEISGGWLLRSWGRGCVEQRGGVGEDVVSWVFGGYG